jgi:hypothetical protein
MKFADSTTKMMAVKSALFTDRVNLNAGVERDEAGSRWLRWATSWSGIRAS